MLPGDLEFCSVSSSNVILWGNSNRNDLCLQCSFYASACLPYFFKLHPNYTDIPFDMLSTAFVPFWCSWAARDQFQTDVRRWKYAWSCILAVPGHVSIKCSISCSIFLYISIAVLAMVLDVNQQVIQPVNRLTSPSYSLIRVLYGDNHACLHTLKMLFILLLISKRSTKSSRCRSGATLSVKSEANSQNKASMSLFLATGCGKEEGQSNHQSVCRTKHGLLQNMQNGTCKCFSSW